MINLSPNETLLLHGLSGVLIIVGFMLGMFIERRKWVKIFRTATAFRKGVVDTSTARAVEALGRLGFTSEEATKVLQDLGKGIGQPMQRQSFPILPKQGGYSPQTARRTTPQ